jgi:hypothetical protein
MPAKKSSKTRSTKAKPGTSAARKQATKSKKTRSTKAKPRTSAVRKQVTRPEKTAAARPKPGSREDHYADLRRVALANALSRIR